MPHFNYVGMDELWKSFGNLANIPEEVRIDMLNAEAKVAMQSQKAMGLAYGVHNDKSTVHILDKMKTTKPRTKGTSTYLYITFSGTRTDSKHDKVRNAEIAFINEYGKEGQEARPFMGDGLDSAQDLIIGAAEEVFNEWVDNAF